MLDFAGNSPDIVTLVWHQRCTRTAWCEFYNKLRAYQAFATAGVWLGCPSASNVDLPRVIVAARALDDFVGLWRTEGVGYYLTAAALEQSNTPRGLFSEAAVQDLTRCGVIPLHTGMGLAFASHQLRCLNRHESAFGIRRCLEKFLRLCRENSADGYVGATVEALGLISRLLRPGMLSSIDEQLAVIDGDLVPLFWHGVGRGIYFLPTNVLPCMAAAWPSLSKARTEPPHELGRENALAGLAWAVTLVNVRDPEVLEAFVKRNHADLQGDAFANGVNSALTVWHDWAPETEYAQRICEYKPRTRRTGFREIWQTHATTHCNGRLQKMHGELRRGNSLQDLFHYRPVVYIGQRT